MRGVALAVALTLALAASALAQPAETASVLVSTVMPHRGSVPEIVTAYGTASPAPGSTTTLSSLRAGQVQDLQAEPGVSVSAGATLVTFAAAPASVLAYDQAVAALSLARKERTHTAQLLSQQLATRSQLAQADKAVADAEAALAAQRREGGGDAVQTLTAPFDGIITAVSVKPGERVAASAPLVTIARADRIVVDVGVEPSLRAKLHPGESVKLESLQGGATVVGTVRQVDAMLDPATRQIGTEIEVPPGSVLAGAGFVARIVVGTFLGWPVPRDAVLTDAKGPYVFQTANSKARRVDVTIVGTFGQTTVVDGPIKPGQPLVTQGNFQLTDGEFVREQPGSAS
jgi:RND family efflux transporter MFP subunit